MAWSSPEPEDDDEARVAKALIQAWALNVQKLVNLRNAIAPAERRTVEALDLKICVLRQMPADHEIRQIKDLAWKYRRQIPRALAPKLPPHDPVVQELEGRR